MFRKKLTFLFVVLCLLFNIQAGFTHGINHINHDHESHENSNDHESHENACDHESHESSNECEECFLIYNLVTSHDLTPGVALDFPQFTNNNSSSNLKEKFPYIFVAYQSQAP